MGRRLAIPRGAPASRRQCAASCRTLFRHGSANSHILAHDIFALPWAGTYDWQGLADQAWSLEPGHRTLGRETIQVRALKRPGAGTASPLDFQP